MKFKFTIRLITNNLIYFCVSPTNTVEGKKQFVSIFFLTFVFWVRIFNFLISNIISKESIFQLDRLNLLIL
jgi:hypothetical protein